MNIKARVHVLIKVRSKKHIQYTYPEVAKSTVDEECDGLRMFLKQSTVVFKLVVNDIRADPFDELLKLDWLQMLLKTESDILPVRRTETERKLKEK